MAQAALQAVGIAGRSAAKALQLAGGAERSKALLRIAEALKNEQNRNLLRDANQADLSAARDNQLDRQLLSRLELTTKKLDAVSRGAEELAAVPDPLGKVLQRRQLTSGLILRREASPLGVLLIIFESRPDALPQIACLGVRSGNGVVLKGGSEARNSNTALHRIIQEAVAATGTIPGEAVQLVHGRENPKRFHVRGYKEEGTTTTPFDMVVLNKMSRYHLAKEALRRSSRRTAGWNELVRLCDRKLAEHEVYIREHLADMPDVAAWTWGSGI